MMLRSVLLSLVFFASAPVLAQAPGAREVADFQGVSVSSGLRAEVKRGNKAVRLEGDAQSVARVRLEVKDGVLTTQVDEGTWSTGGLKGVRLFVTTPRLEQLVASGGSQVEAEASPTDTLKVVASGGSHVRLSGVEAKTLEVRASGGSDSHAPGPRGGARRGGQQRLSHQSAGAPGHLARGEGQRRLEPRGLGRAQHPGHAVGRLHAQFVHPARGRAGEDVGGLARELPVGEHLAP